MANRIVAKLKRKLSETFIKSHRAAPSGHVAVVMDADCPGLGLSVTDKGIKSYVLLARYPGNRVPGKKINPSFRRLGSIPGMTVEEARRKAGKWRDAIKAGVDPTAEEQRAAVSTEQAQAERQRRLVGNLLDTRIEEYLRQHCRHHRQARETARLMEKELAPWKGRGLDTITSRDVKQLVGDIALRSPSVARNVLTAIKSFMSWAEDQEHIETSPAASVRPARIIGERKPRLRVLTDTELKALWKATEALEYPYGPLYRLLCLTGVRLREAAGARWREFDLEARTWRIPAARFKSDAEHCVPLSDAVMALLQELPRFDGDHLFSTDGGHHAINGFSKSKARLDSLMQLADPWRVHDLRRVVRSRLSKLKIEPHVAEMVLGHGKKGLERIYDQHGYEAELRDALDQWAAYLLDVVTPKPDPSGKVVKLKKRA